MKISYLLIPSGIMLIQPIDGMEIFMVLQKGKQAAELNL